MNECCINDVGDTVKNESEENTSSSIICLESSFSENFSSTVTNITPAKENLFKNIIKTESSCHEADAVLPSDVHICKTEVLVSRPTRGKGNLNVETDDFMHIILLEGNEKENKIKFKVDKMSGIKNPDHMSIGLHSVKKVNVSGKKTKHKKYEKPNEQIVKCYQCALCPKVFQRSSSYKAHQRTHTSLTSKPFSCKVCKNTFLYNCQLRDHIRTHTGERPFTCHSCSKTFARKGCLIAHMITHSDSLPFQCDICCKRFARKYNLAKHVQSHSGDRPYRCVSCSRHFKCKQSLDKHHRIHELNIYSCAVCQKSFDTKRRLTHHKVNEHVSYRPFTCQICQKPFIFKSQLTYHIKEHNLERPYSCGKCKKSYFKKGHLLSHIRQYCSNYESSPLVKLEAVF